MKVAYLGPEGTFTDTAAKSIVSLKEYPKREFVQCEDILTAINSLEKGRVDYAVVPIENFYDGLIFDTIDELKDCKNSRIIREKSFQIVHCLGALPKHEKITQVFSKGTALNQCRKYLFNNYPGIKKIPVTSTGEAVNRIYQENLLNAAAIASIESLTLTKPDSPLEVLAVDICPNNRTRFVLLGHEHTNPTGDDRTFILFHPFTDQPGILHTGSGFFSSFGINLDNILSRPDSRGGYYFFAELAGHEKDEPVRRALNNLKYFLDPRNENPEAVKVLGSYANTDWKNGVGK